MRLLSRILGFVPAEERKGIRLEDWPRWEVQPVRAPSLFLGALRNLVPSGSTLYLEDGSPTARIRAYSGERAAAQTCKVQLGTIWPRPLRFHMVMTRENLAGLAELAEGRAAPEIAIHLHVYTEGKVLLEWHDAFYSDPLNISREVPEHKVRAFCNELVVTYEQVTSGA